MKLDISKCPMCESRRVVREIGEFVTHDGFRIPSIEYERCKNCGEKFYDQDASRATDDALRAAGRLKKRSKVYKYPETTAPMVVSDDTDEKSMASENQNVESELLMKINQSLPTALQTRFDELVSRRQDEILTTEEHEELLLLIEQVERMEVVRIKALTQLARFRGISANELMDQFGIQAPEYA